MGGPKSPVKLGGGGKLIGIRMPTGEDVKKSLTSGIDTITGGNIAGTSKSVAQTAGVNAGQDALNAALDSKAKEMGFSSEADRVSQVSRIIDAFGKVKKGKLPAALTGGKTGYTGNIPGIMTKTGG